MDEQLAEGRLKAREVNEMTAIFRTFDSKGGQIYMLREKEGKDGDAQEGLDRRRMGNKIDLDHGSVFVVAASRADELKDLFLNPPAESGVSFYGKFDIEAWNYIGNDGFSDNEGFIVKYRHPDSHGEQVLSEMRFVYAQDDTVKSLDAKRNEKLENRN